MKELLIGYARVSTNEQDLTAQQNILERLGVRGTSDEQYFEVLAPYLLFTWVPTAIVIAVVGIVLFKRAERKSAQRLKE